MTDRIVIGGGAGGAAVSLDVARLVDTRLLIQANSGGGKSWCLRRILEQTHGRVQHIVIDPEGEFSSLRERFDYVLAARGGGDTVADPRSARLLAERLLELNVSAILDIYELKAHERVAFVKNFIEALVDAPKTLWHPALVVLDEAHVYCPEKEKAESAGAVKDLATRGRKRGFCAVLATQRLAKLAKDAAAECNNKLIGRTGLDVDMARAGDELGFPPSRRLELRDLPEGHFFAFGPAISREVVMVNVGKVLTNHPKAGGRLSFTPPPPTEKVRALLPKLADLPAEAEHRQKTMEELRTEVRSLQARLRAAEKGPTAEPPAPPKEVLVLKEADVKRVEAAVEKLLAETAHMLDQVAQRQQVVVSEAGNLRSELKAALATQQDHQRGAAGRILAADGRSRAAVPHLRSAPAAPPNGHATVPEGDLTGPEQRILDALAWLRGVGNDEPEEAAVAFLAGYTVGGGAFNNPRGRLNKRGLIAYKAGGRLAITLSGNRLAHLPEFPLSSDELQRKVLERLPGPEGKLLRPLLKAYPESLTAEELAQASGYTDGGGAFNNPKGRLRTLGLIDYPERGRVVAKSVLFLEGP